MKSNIENSRSGVPTVAVRLMVICGLVVGLSLLYSVYRIKAANTQLHDLTRANFLLSDCRRHEENFLRTNQSADIDAFARTVHRLEAAIETLYDSSFLPVSDLNELDVLVSEYSGAFQGVANALHYIGLEPQSGLRGELQRLSAAVERSLVRFDLQQQQALLQSCRESQENFLKRRDPVYARRFEAAFADLRAGVNAATLPGQEKMRLAGDLAAWRGTETLFFDAVSEIGLGDDSGLLETLVGIRAETEERIKQYEGIISANYTRPTMVIYSTSLLLMVLLMVGAVLVREVVVKNRALRTEIAGREALQQELITHKDNMSQLVSERTRELAIVSTEVRQLRALLPVCSICGEICIDDSYPQQLRDYLSEHRGLDATTRECAECADPCPTLA